MFNVLLARGSMHSKILFYTCQKKSGKWTLMQTLRLEWHLIKKKRRWLNGKFSKMATFDSGYGTDNMRNRVVILRCGNHMEFD